MENRKLNLPVGIQTFEKLRSEGCVYVDKTKYLVDLIDNGSIYFLARPRRFGKSLTISTFDALFSGKKELFKGLYAEEFLYRPNYQPSPVIRLDMSSITTNQGLDTFEASLRLLTIEVAEKIDIDVSKLPSSGDMLRSLIKSASKKYNQQAVILIDEYDKPYTDFVNDPDMAEKVRDILRNYYVQIKSNDEYIRFVFITGISKFAKFGVFSTLNTPLDISMMPEYGSICGYTEEELIHYFYDYLDDTSKHLQLSIPETVEKIRYYYNGFSFDSSAQTRLYNPYSTLTFFHKKLFINYWIHTGKPKFIADYLKSRNLTVEQFRNFPITHDFAESPGDVDSTPPEGFLYQSGYLTLRVAKEGNYTLDYPNIEVLNSMSALVTQNIFQNKGYDSGSYNRRLIHALQNNDYELFKNALNTLLASIPYDDFSKAAEECILIHNYKFPAQEWLYRSSILSFLRGCGVVVEAELHTHLGRPDLVISYNGNVWIIEIKVAYQNQNTEKKAEEALRQIIDKQYAKPYPNAVSIGLGIDDALRQISAIRVQ